MRVYFAGPLFNAAERAFNAALAARIESLGSDVRTAFASAGLNPMISQALDRLCTSTEELESVLDAYIASMRCASGEPGQTAR